jgi:hypothetical protein
MSLYGFRVRVPSNPGKKSEKSFGEDGNTPCPHPGAPVIPSVLQAGRGLPTDRTESRVRPRSRVGHAQAHHQRVGLTVPTVAGSRPSCLLLGKQRQNPRLSVRLQPTAPPDSC